MKKSNQVSHRVLRMLVTIVAFAVIAATSVVYVEAKEIVPKQDEIEKIDSKDIQSISVDRKNNLITIIKKDGTQVSYTPEETLKKEPIILSDEVEPVIVTGVSTQDKTSQK